MDRTPYRGYISLVIESESLFLSPLLLLLLLLLLFTRYEFNESDLRMMCDTLDTWLDTVAQGRTNLPPDKIPWSTFRTLLSQSIYGGQIDNDFDQVRDAHSFN